MDQADKNSGANQSSGLTGKEGENMKSKIITIFWGIMLIVLSGLLLAEVLGFINFGSLSLRGRAAIFWVASSAFFLTYFLSGIKKWGWLFPALICAVMGWNSLQAGRAMDLVNLDWPMLAALSIPFYVGFFVNRKSWGLLIPAYLLSAAALINFSNEMVSNTILSSSVERVIPMVLFSGVMPLFLLALPFFVVYFWSKKNWWALIPAGFLTSLSLVVVLSIFVRNDHNTMTGIYIGTMLLGFAATMAVLWLRRGIQPTGWAKYPAAGLLLLAVVAFILGNGWQALPQNYKAVVFAAGSAVFLLIYFLHGLKKWGWLFPAFLCAGMAMILWLESKGMDDSITGVPLFASMALPCFAAFAADRKQRWLLIPGTFLSAFTVFIEISATVQDVWSGVSFFLLLALTFIITYFVTKRSWWALIPAGISASFGLVMMAEILIPHTDYSSRPNTLEFGVFTWVLFLGLAATFCAVWLHRKTEATDWAKYPAVGLCVIAVLSFMEGATFAKYWLVTAALVAGVMFLLTVLMRKKLTEGEQTPKIKA
jgi:hypothetical protein